MQDEVNEKVVSLAIKTSKLTAEVLQKAMKALLAKGKGQLTKAPHGKIFGNGDKWFILGFNQADGLPLGQGMVRIYRQYRTVIRDQNLIFPVLTGQVAGGGQDEIKFIAIVGVAKTVALDQGMGQGYMRIVFHK